MAWIIAFFLSVGAAASRADETRGADQGPAEVSVVYERLKRLAAERAYDIRISREGSEQRDAHLYTSWARWLPRLEFQLSQARSKDYSIITSGALGTFADAFAPQAISLSRWALNLQFPIYDRVVHVNVL